MGNERKLRLIQVAKEFKVGLNTITDFLQKKGIKSDGSPNTLVDAETYAVLEKEFGANRAAGNARESIRERISLKQTTITLEEAKKQEREEEKEVVIKSNVISVKDEIQQPESELEHAAPHAPRPGLRLLKLLRNLRRAAEFCGHFLFGKAVGCFIGKVRVVLRDNILNVGRVLLFQKFLYIC